jgi:hypothetical protein
MCMGCMVVFCSNFHDLVQGVAAVKLELHNVVKISSCFSVRDDGANLLES